MSYERYRKHREQKKKNREFHEKYSKHSKPKEKKEFECKLYYENGNIKRVNVPRKNKILI